VQLFACGLVGTCKFLNSSDNVDVDTDFTCFHSQASIKKITSNRCDTNQHVARTYASVIKTSLHRRENKVPWINRTEFKKSNKCMYIHLKITSDYLLPKIDYKNWEYMKYPCMMWKFCEVTYCNSSEHCMCWSKDEFICQRHVNAVNGRRRIVSAFEQFTMGICLDTG